MTAGGIHCRNWDPSGQHPSLPPLMPGPVTLALLETHREAGDRRWCDLADGSLRGVSSRRERVGLLQDLLHEDHGLRSPGQSLLPLASRGERPPADLP